MPYRSEKTLILPELDLSGAPPDFGLRHPCAALVSAIFSVSLSAVWILS